MRDKQQRQTALLKLVRQRPVRNQAQLVEALNKRGFSATQASISRDLLELGFVKNNGRYVSAARLTGPRTAATAQGPASELINSADPAGANLIVVRTAIGAASVVAVDLDGRQIPGVVGTIAGDDTVFVAVRSRSAQGRVAALLQGWIRSRG